MNDEKNHGRDMATVFPFADGNDLIVYPIENQLHPFDWIQPDDDEPFVVTGEGGEPPKFTMQELEEAYKRYLTRYINQELDDRPF